MTPTPEDRQPPFSESAERSVLGSVLLDDRKVLDICQDYNLAPEAFYVPSHRLIYEAMLRLQQAQKPVDMMTLPDALGDKLDAVGGIVALHKLEEDTPTAAHCEHYLDIVTKKWRRRSMQKLLNWA